MSVDFQLDSMVDLRQPILGDSFSWAGTEPTAAKKSLVFHHSASDSPAEDGFSIADYHVNHKGWKGIGYHLVITRKDYPGRSGFTNPGAQIQYVGDLGTWRAHVENQNNGRVGICFVGMTPDEEQLKLGRKLVDFFIAQNNVLPSINYYNQVTVHRLVPDQSTSCPGDDYGNWLPYLQGGADPFATPEPPVIEEPVAEPGVELPEYERTYKDDPSTQISKRDSVAHDMTGEGTLINVPKGSTVDVAGSFQDNGVHYVRTVYSKNHGKWYGLPFEAFQDEPSGQVPDAEIPVNIIDTPPISVLADQTVGTETDITPPPKKSFGDIFWSIFGLLLRKLGKIIKRN